MTTSQLKLQLFRKIDRLQARNVKEAYGILLNYINKTTSGETWDSLIDAERAAIEEGISQLDRGEGIPHQRVMAKYRKKYSA